MMLCMHKIRELYYNAMSPVEKLHGSGIQGMIALSGLSDHRSYCHSWRSTGEFLFLSKSPLGSPALDDLVHKGVIFLPGDTEGYQWPTSYACHQGILDFLCLVGQKRSHSCGRDNWLAIRRKQGCFYTMEIGRNTYGSPVIHLVPLVFSGPTVTVNRCSNSSLRRV